uniref:HD domain-containing protein n=1 Tax=Fervidobacterium nodosum TaxID=2424 RepID=A0A7C5U2D0_9BACT
MKKMRSINKCLKKSTVLVIILILYSFSMMGLIVYEIESFEKIYIKLRNYFSIINDVVAGRKQFDVLLEPMKEFDYDYQEYENLLSSHKTDTSYKKSLLAEIRNFANFLRNYERDKLLEHDKIIRISYLSLIIGSAIIIMFLIILNNRVKKYIKKVVKKIGDISDNMYISEVPVDKAVFEEDVMINNSIHNINLVQSIYDIFKHLPINTAIEDFTFTVGSYLCNLFNSQRFSVAFIDWETENVIAEVAHILIPNIVPRLNAGFTQKLFDSSLGEMVRENRLTRIINDLEERYNLTQSESTKLILEEGFKSNLTALATINSRPFGFFFLSSEKKGNYTERDAKLFASISGVLSYRLYYSLTIQKLLSYFANSLVNLVEFKDNETGNHIKRVSMYAKIIAEELNLSPKLVREIYEFAPLHDIGKVGIPDAILLKPGKLDPEEWEIMKTHVTNGVKIIEQFQKDARSIMEPQSLVVMKNIIAEHHERWDGKGYPDGKKGEEISIEGRIVALADVFDALTTKRPYKDAFPFEKAVEMIIQERGTHFDPNVVDAFLKKIVDIRMVYENLKD